MTAVGRARADGRVPDLGSLGGRQKGNEGKGWEGHSRQGEHRGKGWRLRGRWGMGVGCSGGAWSPLSAEEEEAADGNEAHTAVCLFTTVSQPPQQCWPCREVREEAEERGKRGSYPRDTPGGDEVGSDE